MAETPRAAVVTGAARGLGLAVATQLLQAGNRVTLVDIDGELLERARPAHGDTHLIAADLGRTTECDRVIAEAIAQWGGVDVLVNCAAILQRLEFDDIDEAVFARIFNINVRSVFWLCRAAVADMQKRGWGRIVNTTSVGIHTGGYSISSAVYEATKGAVHNFTKTLARSVAKDGILVNSVAPGGMRTRMLTDQTPAELLVEVEKDIPLGRLAEPDEVASMIVYLASARNTYATGGGFDVNAGVAMI
jgi:NAD(P)-dependent dehydrogenase (short-subunit alcohol dehydrogenase family)